MNKEDSVRNQSTNDGENSSDKQALANAKDGIEPDTESPIATEIERFVNHVQSLGSSLPMSMVAMNAALGFAHKEYADFAAGCETVEAGPPRWFRVPVDKYYEHLRLDTELERTHIAMHVVPKSFVVALVSQFDSYLGGLVRAFFNLRPELLNASERNLTFKELKEFSSLEDARDFILEKEIETILRKSHVEQFEWMESKFKIKLREGLPSWPIFVEVTERRNLFVSLRRSCLPPVLKHVQRSWRGRTHRTTTWNAPGSRFRVFPQSARMYPRNRRETRTCTMAKALPRTTGERG